MNTTEKHSLSLNALSASFCLFLSLVCVASALVVEERAWVDWGEVHNARELTHEFVLRNDSSEPCQILEVQAECSLCTHTELSQDYIPPGESVVLKASLLTESLSGPVVKSIVVKVAHPEEVLVLGFRATVKPRFEFSEEAGAGVVSIKLGEVKRKTLSFRDTEAGNWSDVTVDSSPVWLGVSVSVDQEQRSLVHVHAEVAPGALASGLHLDFLRLRRGEDIVEIPQRILVENAYIITPEELSFTKAPGPQRQIVRYKALDRSYFIKKVNFSDEAFRAEVKPDFSPGEYRIYVYASALEGYTMGDARMRIETVGEREELIEVPLWVRP